MAAVFIRCAVSSHRISSVYITTVSWTIVNSVKDMLHLLNGYKPGRIRILFNKESDRFCSTCRWTNSQLPTPVDDHDGEQPGSHL